MTRDSPPRPVQPGLRWDLSTRWYRTELGT